MRSSPPEGAWHDLAEAAWTGLAAWRRQHPKATLAAIEQAVDARLAGLRARAVRDAALASARTDPAASGERPSCPECGAPLRLGGARTRRLRTRHARDLDLPRAYARCPACGTGGSPLDEALARLPGALTPALREGVVRPGAWVPFARAAALLAYFTQATIGEATARRLTAGAGAAYEAVPAAEVARIGRELPEDPTGPAVQQVGGDGVLVPVLGGAWVAAKGPAIGAVVRDAGDGEARATEPSSSARHAEAAAFAQRALGEVHRRGTATAGTVVGIADGAVWCRGGCAAHCPEAVRILDLDHARTHLAAAAQAAFGPGTAAASGRLGTQCHAPKHKTPEGVLAALAALPVAAAPSRAAAAAAQAAAVGYLSARLERARYAAFLAAGDPIGSGAVESAHKLVVEARPKRGGVHWALAHVNPMLALRAVARSDRWAAVWPRITAAVRQRARLTVAARRPDRRAQRPAAPIPPPAPAAAPRPAAASGRPRGARRGGQASPTHRRRPTDGDASLETGLPHPRFPYPRFTRAPQTLTDTPVDLEPSSLILVWRCSETECRKGARCRRTSTTWSGGCPIRRG